MGYAMTKEFGEALSVLELYKSKLCDKEVIEIMLFKNRILRDAGLHEEALSHLNEISPNILQTVREEVEGQIHINLNNLEAAKEIYRSLFKIDCENETYLKKYLEATQGANDKNMIDICRLLNTQHPNLKCLQKILMHVENADIFKDLIKTFIQSSLVKGSFTLFDDLQEYCQESSKKNVIDDVLKSFSIQQCFSADENKTSVMSTLYFLLRYELHLGKSYLTWEYSSNDHVKLIYRDLPIIQKCFETFFKKQELTQKNETNRQWLQLHTALGNCFERMGKLYGALKIYKKIDRNYWIQLEKGFDLEKGVGVADYFGLLQLEDKYSINEYYRTAAKCGTTVSILFEVKMSLSRPKLTNANLKTRINLFFYFK